MTSRPVQTLQSGGVAPHVLQTAHAGIARGGGGLAGRTCVYICSVGQERYIDCQPARFTHIVCPHVHATPTCTHLYPGTHHALMQGQKVVYHLYPRTYLQIYRAGTFAGKNSHVILHLRVHLRVHLRTRFDVLLPAKFGVSPLTASDLTRMFLRVPT